MVFNREDEHNRRKYGHYAYCNIMFPTAECVCDCAIKDMSLAEQSLRDYLYDMGVTYFHADIKEHKEETYRQVLESLKGIESGDIICEEFHD